MNQLWVKLQSVCLATAVLAGGANAEGSRGLRADVCTFARKRNLTCRVILNAPVAQQPPQERRLRATALPVDSEVEAEEEGDRDRERQRKKTEKRRQSQREKRRRKRRRQDKTSEDK